MDLPNIHRPDPAYVAVLEAIVAAQAKQIALLTPLTEVVVNLQARVEELERRLKSNSNTSSKPPSSDGYAKRTTSKRSKSSRPPGKQPGSPGKHLAQVTEPDEIVVHRQEQCGKCNATLRDAEVLATEVRQVFDVPPMRLRVTEHRVEWLRCGCGEPSAGGFPGNVRVAAQYGSNLRALATYLCIYQHLPYERTAQLLSDWLCAPVATGTLVNIIADASERVAPTLDVIKTQIIKAPVVHADETGARVEAKLHWIHSASTNEHTLYTAHRRRGRIAMNDAGILPSMKGILVHDGWAPYRGYGTVHGLCNAHHLRELAAAAEFRSQTWANDMIDVLIGVKGEVDSARASGVTTLSAARLAHWNGRYDTALKTGNRNNEIIVSRKPFNLLRRLRTYRDEVLRFATDFRVPFDNNLAERDIRMVKLTQKISGSHRSFDGADRFCRIRSYISTARKHHQNVAGVLRDLFDGDPWIPHQIGADP